jgi:hypothetical protein
MLLCRSVFDADDASPLHISLSGLMCPAISYVNTVDVDAAHASSRLDLHSFTWVCKPFTGVS